MAGMDFGIRQAILENTIQKIRNGISSQPISKFLLLMIMLGSHLMKVDCMCLFKKWNVRPLKIQNLRMVDLIIQVTI